MASGKGSRNKGESLGKVQDYRHGEAKRPNIPPAKLAAEGQVPLVGKVRYAYNPHRPPALRWHPDGEPDRLPELLEAARKRPLTDEEARTLNEALRHQQPWLEWAEKREQHERGDFEVDPVALHIHERVSAQAILKAAARQDPQRELFADPELDYHEAVQFYRHQMDWANRLILGDSLQVMSSLAQREDLAGKVQMIYMDPPYGIKFASNFQPEVGRRDVKDKDSDLTREPEMVKAYRDTWHLGIHSYLSYLRDRLIVARELLADTGSIFVQISDENLHRVRQVMDEVFGAGHFCGIITFQKTGSIAGTLLGSTVDFLIWYAKDRNSVKYNQLYEVRASGDTSLDRYDRIESEDGTNRRITSAEYSSNDLVNKRYRLQSIFSSGATSIGSSPVEYFGRIFPCLSGNHWKTNEAGMSRLAHADRLAVEGVRLRYKRYVADYPVFPISDRWESVQIGTERQYVVQTSSSVVQRCMLMTTDPGDLVLDPTCGSGTTAYVAEQWGRRWITIDTSRVAIAIARQRLLTGKFEMYKVVEATPSSLGSSVSGEGAASTAGQSAYEKSGGGAASTGFEIAWFDPDEPVGNVRGGNLPHWRQPGVTYFVTWRTADSMPKDRVEQWAAEREAWLKKHPEPWDEKTKAEYDRLFLVRWEQWLDEAHGECVLRRPDIRKVVENSLRCYDGSQYELTEYVVAPNHVHVLVKPLEGYELSDIVQAWKSVTAHAINKALGRKGSFWRKESFDHIVRNPAEFERIRQYIRNHDTVEAAPSPLNSADDDLSGGGAASTNQSSDWGAASTNQPSGEGAVSTKGVDPGRNFKYKTVPHITLKSIAQNQNLDPIFEKWEPILEEKLAACNKALEKVDTALRQRLKEKLYAKQAKDGKRAITDADERRWLLPPENRGSASERKRKAKGYTVDLEYGGWYHWEVPFDTDPDWLQPLQEAVTAYREAWRGKMDEVNQCIADNAEHETLVDQPEVVTGVTRVTGPFTVEAVQPPEMSLGDPSAVIEGTGGFGGAPEELDTGFDGDERPDMVLRKVEARPDLDAQNLEAYLDQMVRLLRKDGVRFPDNKQMVFSRLDAIYA
ncbi:MAG: DNA methyltransferase [Candidatus Hydrogenedentota bacterium]